MNRMASRSLSAFLLLTPLFAAAASDGELDPGFSGNGKAVVGFTVNTSAVSAQASAMAIQQDGKIVLVGLLEVDTISVLARLTPDGALDSSFGSAGRVEGLFLKQPGVADVAKAVALQPDGKIVVFGVISSSAYVARLTATGQLDVTFGNGGTVVYPTSGPGTARFKAGAITQTGAILASGTYDDGLGGGPSLLNVLFSAQGTVLAAQIVSSVLSFDKGALVIQADGKAVIAVTGSHDCVIVRDNVGTSLSLDSGFGSGGIGSFGWNLGGDNQDYCNALALQRDGKILMGGQATVDASGGSRATVLRLLPDGTLDPDFGKKNFTFASAAPGMGSTTTAIVVQNDQRIVLTGIADTADPAHAPQDFAALRLFPDGTLDATFTATTPGSSLGKVVFGFETTSSGRLDEAFAAGLQGNRIVIAGFRETSNAAMTEQFAIARLQNDGMFADGFDP